MRQGGSFEIAGSVVDVVRGEVFRGRVVVARGRVAAVVRDASGPCRPTVVPGLVDAHVHVESSMLAPSEFARQAVRHGTVATVSDPHEVANVLGLVGVDFMIENGRAVPFKLNFGAPSCVPATPHETSGAVLTSAEVESLLEREEILFLAEMMNYPGVVDGDPEVAAKLAAARRVGKPVDGHAPLLSGADLAAYVGAGITTDHEATSLEEAREKIRLGMKIIIREGSAAQDFETLAPLLGETPDRVMLGSDDLHPDDLVRGHLDRVVRRAMTVGYDPLAVLRAVTLNPVRHYGLDVGLLQVGDPADLVVVDDLASFRVLESWVGGRRVVADGVGVIPRVPVSTPNRFVLTVPLAPAAFRIPARGRRTQAIGVLEGSLVTERRVLDATVAAGAAIADPARDLLKVAVVNRYREAPAALGFVHGFGLVTGALASSVAHDSHNIVAVGASDEALAAAVNAVIEHRGGLAAAGPDSLEVLPLPVAGIMSDLEGPAVARRYQRLGDVARRLGSPLRAPFMTLSFLSLLVIPHLKLSDRGLFDGDAFRFTELFVD